MQSIVSKVSLIQQYSTVWILIDAALLYFTTLYWTSEVIAPVESVFQFDVLVFDDHDRRCNIKVETRDDIALLLGRGREVVA
jgi:hypothetical protein